MVKKQRLPLRLRVKNRFLARLAVIAAALVLVVAVIPVGLAVEGAKESAGTPESAIGTVEASLDLGHGYITYDGQTVSQPSNKLVIAADKDFTFSATADAGYTLDAVELTGPGARALAAQNGAYVIDKASITEGIGIKLVTSEEPEVAVEATEPITEAAPVEEAKTTWSFEDAAVLVTATLQDAGAVPANAEFRVTPLANDSSAHDAYLAALNSGQNPNSGSVTYTDQNTLLYDISFIVDGKEFEPESGSVTIDAKFKQNQLADDLGVTAADAGDVEITHLPLKDASISSTDAGITADDVKVEPIAEADAKVDAGAQSAEFKLSSLSVVALTNKAPTKAEAAPPADRPDGASTETEKSAAITFRLSFVDASGNALEQAPSLGDDTYLYAYVEQGYNKHYVAKLDAQGSAYVGSTECLFTGDYNGKKQVPVDSNGEYSVFLFTSYYSNIDEDKWLYEHGVHKINTGTQIAGEYVATVPEDEKVTGGGTYDVMAKPLGVEAIEAALSARMTVNGNDPGDSEFDFTLSEHQTDGTWKNIQTVQNDGAAVNFSIMYDSATFEPDDKQGGSDSWSWFEWLREWFPFLWGFGTSETQTQTHIYCIKEANSGNLTPDVDAYYAQVVVAKTEKGGETTFTASEPKYFSDKECTRELGSVPVFNNTGDAQGGDGGKLEGRITFQGTKTMIGRNLASGETYSFSIYEKLADGSEQLVNTATSAAGGGTGNMSTITFPEIKYTYDSSDTTNSARVLGEHIYIVSEDTKDLPASIEATTSPHSVKVYVTKGEDELVPIITSVDGETVNSGTTPLLNFENKYEASTSIQFAGKKSMKGRALADCDNFIFDIEESVWDATANNGTGAYVLTDRKLQAFQSGTVADINYPPIAYSQADIGKSFRYVVTEQLGNNVSGVTTSSQQYEFPVTVRYDPVKREMVAEPGNVDEVTSGAKDGSIEHLDFVNEYKPRSATAEIAPRKMLVYANENYSEASLGILKDSIFTYELVDENGKVIQTVQNAEDGSIPFEKLTYGESGEYKYTIREVIPDGVNPEGGITYDRTVYGATVTVTDDPEKGELEASVAYTRKIDSNGVAVAGIVPVNGDQLVFKNNYKAEDAIIVLEAKKSYAGGMLEADDFKFTLSSSDPASVETIKTASNGSNTITVGNDANGNIIFPELKFIKAGEYKYTISEVIPDGANEGNNYTVNGVTYDSAPRVVTVNVIDDGEGKLHAEAVYDKDADGNNKPIVFTNSYSATSAFANLKVTKGIENDPEWKTNKTFEFTLAPVVPEPGAPVPPMPTGTGADGKASISINNSSADHANTFEEIEYKEAGEYRYTITESVPAGATQVEGSETQFVHEGITYDTTPQNATVIVADDGQGALFVESITYGAENYAGDALGAASAVFTNSYHAASVTSQLQVTKNLTGREWTDDDKFSFTLSASGSAPMPANGGEKADVEKGRETALFGEITFDHAGTFTYAIIEDAPAGGTLNGITYDNNTHSATVEVVDNNKGQLVVESVTYQDGVSTSTTSSTFTNTYSAASTSAKLKAAKHLESRNWAPGEAFSFTLMPVDGAPMPNGSVDDGAKTVSATQEGAPVGFGSITYAKADTYSYTIAEAAPEGATDAGNGIWMLNGVAYDTNPKPATVVVADDNMGKLYVQEIRYDGESYEGAESIANAAAVITNNYVISGEVPVVLKANKALTGTSTDLIGGDFTFELTGANEIAMQTIRKAAGYASETLTATNDKDGNIAFAPLVFTEVGTYKYTMREIEGSEPGVTYDKKACNVVVEVTDNGQGGLTATATYDGQTTPPTFTNTYTAVAGEATLNVTKALTGRLWAEGETFDFTLSAETQGAPMPEGNGNKVAVGSNGETKAFGSISYSEPGEYRYKITEKVPFVEGLIAPKNSEGASVINGVTYDNTVHYVTVTVTDNRKTGKLETDVQYEDETDAAKNAAIFENKYSAEATDGVEIRVAKQLDGREWKSGDEFSFRLSAAEGVPMPEDSVSMDDGGGNVAKTIAVTGKLSESFGAISYAKAGTYAYTITEVDPGEGNRIPGVTYNTTSQAVTVRVTDDGKGELEAQVDYGNEKLQSALFTNTYKAASTSVALGATKSYEGATLTDGDFTFQLKGDNALAKETIRNATDGESDTLTTTNNKDGIIAFASLHFTEVGTYEYAMSEVIPDEANRVSGVTYDDAKHSVKVEVVDNKAGQLEATVTYGNQPTPPVFTNSYFFAQTGTQIAATKYFFGDSPTAFSFTLTAANADWTPRAGGAQQYTSSSENIIDNIIDNGTDAFEITVQNGSYADQQAPIGFPQIGYTKPGSYYYVMAEKPMDGYMTDTVEYLVKVDVADNMNVTTTYTMRYYGETEEIDSADVAFYNNNDIMLSFMSLGAMGMGDGYDSASINVYPTVYNQLDGTSAGLSAGEYTFLLSDESGAVFKTGTNDSNGEVTFYGQGAWGLNYTLDDLEGANSKTFHYTITELNGGATLNGIVYDDAVVGLTVKVDKVELAPGQFGLEATCTYDIDGAAVETPTFNNTTETTNVHLQKVSRMGGEGLEDCTYGLWMANESGADILLGEAVTDANGWMEFENVDLKMGSRYYFKEVIAPEGHKVDPYRSVYLTPAYDENGALVLVLAEETDDGLHAAGK